MRWVLALLVMLAAAADARAQAPAEEGADRSADRKEQARERFVRGVERMRVKDYAGAVAEFQRAYEIAPYPVVLYNLGIAYDALGRPVEAVEAMKAVIDKPGNLAPERLARARTIVAENEARVGELEVVVNEAGALLRVDDIDRGKSPLAAALRVRAGTHFVQAVKTGYVPVRREILVAGGDKKRVELTLERTELRPGQIWIRSKLPGAQIFIDGAKAGTTPLSQSISVMPGQHNVELRRAGYETDRQTITLGEGATATLRIELEPDRDAIDREGGRVKLTMPFEDAVVSVDGQSTGVYTGPIKLAPGPHTLRVERGGFVPTVLAIDVAAGGTTELAVDLEPTPEWLADKADEQQTYHIIAGLLTGFGVAGLGAGIGVTAWNETRRNDAIDESRSETQPGGRCVLEDGSRANNQAYCDELVQRLERTNDVRIPGYVTLGIGAALLVTGVTLFFVAPDPDDYHAEHVDELARLRLLPMLSITPDEGLLGVAGTF
jgi:hypothetical protein